MMDSPLHSPSIFACSPVPSLWRKNTSFDWDSKHFSVAYVAFCPTEMFVSLLLRVCWANPWPRSRLRSMILPLAMEAPAWRNLESTGQSDWSQETFLSENFTWNSQPPVGWLAKRPSVSRRGFGASQQGRADIYKRSSISAGGCCFPFSCTREFGTV